MRIPLHSTLAMRIRLPLFFLPSLPIEVRFAGLGGRRGLASDMDEQAIRSAFVCPGSQEGNRSPYGLSVV
eukprot:11176933-Lingulodinium_polyedra.AAC.1